MEYYGDVRVMPTEDGGSIEFSNGQPAMDQGLSTAVYLSLYTSRGWWADPEMGSTLESLESKPLTNQTKLDAIEACKLALAWLVNSGIATEVQVSAEIIAQNVLGLVVRIVEPSRQVVEMRYRINWLNMQEVR